MDTKMCVRPEKTESTCLTDGVLSDRTHVYDISFPMFPLPPLLNTYSVRTFIGQHSKV